MKTTIRRILAAVVSAVMMTGLMTVGAHAAAADFRAFFDTEGVARVVTDGTEIAVEGLAPGETTLTLTLIYADGSKQTVSRRIAVG